MAFLGLVAALPAQDFTPERVGNMTYQKNYTSGMILPSVSVLLSSDGFVYTLHSPVNGVVGPVVILNRYSWLKTGPNSGTFTIGDQGVTLVTFTSPNAGTYRDGLGGGTIVFTPLRLSSNTPLANVSTRVTLAPGQPALVGFVVRGTVPRRVLVRAIGPSLAQFGVGNAAANPALTVLKGNVPVGSNVGWGGAASLAAAFSAVGAFALPTTSRDSALLLELDGGNYTALARADNGGEVLVEVYLVDID